MIDPVIVVLSQYELRIAEAVAELRHASARLNGRRAAYGQGADRVLADDITGAIGEIAVARAFNIFWRGVGEMYAGDVGGLEVRTTRHKNGRLILHDRDRGIFILVYVLADHCELAGWIRAEDGKRPEWIADPQGGRAAYFIPRDELRPMFELLAPLEKERPAPWKL